VYPSPPEGALVDVVGALEVIPLGDRERGSVLGVNEQGRDLAVGVGPEVLEHEVDRSSGIAATAVCREHVVADVHLLGCEPPAVVVTVVVHPTDDQAVDDDDELGSGDCGSFADEAVEWASRPVMISGASSDVEGRKVTGPSVRLMSVIG